jgi:hypothetical protein
MSFALFLLIYAAIAIALVAVVWLILREVRRKRLDKVQPLRPPEPRDRPAPKVRLPARRKTTAEPEPETPPPPRRRQLQTFADAEKAAAEHQSIDAVPEPNAPDAPGDADAVPEPDTPDAVADADVPVIPVETETDYAQAVLDRLEDVFERFQAGDITLDAYRAEVQAEQAAIDQRIAALDHDPDSAAMAAALAARESARWCLDWADEQVHPGDKTPGE